MILPYWSFSEVMSQNTHTHTHTYIYIYDTHTYIYIYVYIPLFCILLMEGHTAIEHVLRPAIFWGCVQHKVLIPFQCFGITNQSRIQGSRCPSRTCLGSIQLAHTGYLLGELTVTELI